MSINDIDVDTRTQEILLAASNHDLDALKPFLRAPGAASVQDLETGFTPLHAAIAACGPADSHEPNSRLAYTEAPANGTTNGHAAKSNEDDEKVDFEKAKATVNELFLSGAIWNDLDMNDETPGCLAWRLGQKELYELVVEAGVRAELLLNLMGGYEPLDSDDDDDEEEAEEEVIETEEKAEVLAESNTESQQSASQIPEPEPDPTSKRDVNSEDYLKSDLTITTDTLLDTDSNGVMMSWETPIMELSASHLAPTSSLRILNIGFGLGIIDSLFASTYPSAHHIIEAHPAVLSALRDPPSNLHQENNFLKFGPSWLAANPGKNMIHAGRWQEIVPKLIEQEEVFDAIYFDTFGEDYSELKLFFSEYVIALMAPEGKFSFFNGLGADRRVCYDVYCRIVECDLADAGLECEWVDVDVDLEGTGTDEVGKEGKKGNKGLGKEGEGEWKGVRKRYWTLNQYRLPVCSFMG